jgi:N-methylhydantoinase B
MRVSMEPFTYEIVRDTLYSICEEMMTELRKICISTVIREAQDCATAITDASGRLIAQSTGTPGHYNSIPTAVKGILQKFPAAGMSEGDVLLTNDPWLCAGHLPDVVIVTPLFFRGKVFAFAATIGHQLDMGGKNPGSTTANTTEIYQDGLQLPPLKIVSRGEPQTGIFDIIRENGRLPDVVIHDIESEMTVNAHGGSRLVTLCQKYGPQVILECFDRSIRASETLLREEIDRIPDGSWSWEDYVEDDGVTDVPLVVRATVKVQGNDLYVDFAGSAPQARGGINMTPSFRDSYTHLAIRCFLDPKIPHNEGCFVPIHISAPPGTIVSPLRPAGIGGRSVLISRVADVVIACLSQAMPNRAVGGYGGCNAQPVLSGSNPVTGRDYILLDSSWGGLGGRHGKDGVTCLSFPQNVGNHPIEVIEAFYPLQIERYAIRPDSEGPGEFRGGFGSIKDYRLLAPARLQVPGDRTKLPPFGLQGGGSAVLTHYLLERGGEELELKTKREYLLEAGDLLSVRTPGGGGLGDPLARAPDRIAEDLTLGYISAEHAANAYGVVVEDAESVATQMRVRRVSTSSKG